MGIDYSAYLILGYKIKDEKDSKIVEQLKYKFWDEDICSLEMLELDKFLVLGKIIKSYSHYDNKRDVYEIKSLSVENINNVKKILKEDYELDLGEPKLLFLMHA